MSESLEGIIVPKTIGIGDAVQFTSVPENYFLAHQKKLVDLEEHWVFDHNPYVVRGVAPLKVYRLWNQNPPYKPLNRPCYTSLAEKHAGILNVEVRLRHPRLYKFEDFPFCERKMILFQVIGKSHGRLPDNIIEHVLQKYRDCSLIQIGLNNENLGIPWIETKTLWDLVELISQCRMIIGPDSGPTWIASCYPDVIVKKVRLKPSLEFLKEWVPLAADNLHAQWDDLQLFSCYNSTEEDVGFTSSFRKI